ncbi:MAG: diacylglycerol kinase family lipid kinase [Aerococcus sp.]|nr:diacylglycerol kinase family lipid kinase [Aerococcus sp.]
MNEACLIINPVAGSGDAKRMQHDVANFLYTLVDRVEVIMSTPERTVASIAKVASDDGADLIFVLGGDGSVSEAVNGIMNSHASPRFGFLPFGTANDLARNIGINPNPKLALRELRKGHAWRSIDVGEVNGQYFIDAVALGSLAEAVMATDDQSKKLLGYFAYIKDGAKAMLTRQPKAYTITSKSFNGNVRTHLMMVTIGNTVGRIEQLVNGASSDDGYLYFLAAKDNLKLPNWNHVLKAFVNRDVWSLDEVTTFRTRELTIEGRDTAQHGKLNVDGDEGPVLPAHLSVHPQALNVLIPADRSSK